MKTPLPQESPVEVAAEKLLFNLDAMPRRQWRQAVVMALQAMREEGHREGFKTGCGEVGVRLNTPIGFESGGLAAMAGEDRALDFDEDDAKISEEERLQEQGFIPIVKLAEQLGRFMDEGYNIRTVLQPHVAGSVQVILVAERLDK